MEVPCAAMTQLQASTRSKARLKGLSMLEPARTNQVTRKKSLIGSKKASRG
jgi:hypothetical protein